MATAPELPGNCVSTASVSIEVGEAFEGNRLVLAYGYEGSVEMIVYALERMKLKMLNGEI